MQPTTGHADARTSADRDGQVETRGPTAPQARLPRAFGSAAIRTAVVVGTALTFINHPTILWTPPTRDIVVKTLLNFLVPFLVAGYSRHALLRGLRTRNRRR